MRTTDNTQTKCDVSSEHRANLSIVIAAHNRIAFLDRAIRSVASQRLLPAEVIVVDDGSSPPVYVDRLQALCPRVPMIILRNERPNGAAKARQKGAMEATQPIVAFLDSDDALTEDYIATVDAAWCRDPEVACIAVGFYWCTEALRPYRIQRVRGNVTYDRLLRQGNFVGGASVLSVNRARFIAAGGFPETPGSHDWGLLLRLAQNGRIETLRKPLVYYQSPVFGKHTLTQQYRRQILSIGAIVRSISHPEDRKKIGDIHRELVFLHLVTGRRLRFSRGILLSLMMTSRISPRKLLWFQFVQLLGGQCMHNVQKLWALLRSQFYRKRSE